MSIAKQLPEMRHIVVHGVRMWADALDKAKGQFPSGVDFIEWHSAGREINPIKDIRALGELVHILKPYKNTQTLIHLHSSKAGFLGRLACRLVGISRVLYTPHCASFIRTDISPFKRKLFRFLETLGLWFGGTVVGCGQSEAELYRQRGKPVLWVSNGVAITPAVKDKEPKLISFAGTVSIQKNPVLFNRIAEAFQSEPVPFCWIGDGPLRECLSSHNITLTGWVDKKNVDASLYKTLVYLSTASWEGLPFGVLEAMNASCALLLRDVPGNRDLVVSGENGYLFTHENEAATLLHRMLEDKEKTKMMGKKSRALVESQYSLEKMGQGYGDIYRSTMGLSQTFNTHKETAAASAAAGRGVL